MFRRSPSPLPAVPLHVTTTDHVELSGLTIDAPGPLHFVLAHGFTNHSAKPDLIRLAARLSRFGAVSAVDFRGHGESAGGSTVGGDGEMIDLDAVIADVRRRAPDRFVVVVGFSMGAAAAIRQAGLAEHRPDAVVSVSAVSRWFSRDSRSMRRVNWLLESRFGPPFAQRGLGTRLGESWPEAPVAPLGAIASVTCPILLIHGTADQYFDIEHAYALQTASGGHAELWTIEGFGHGESAMTPALCDRLAQWAIGQAAAHTGGRA